MPMTHILLCPHKLDFGGSQSSLLHWAKYLDRSRFKVTVVAMGRGGLSEKFEAAFPVYYDDAGYPGITGYITGLKPDILHAGPPGGNDLAYITEASRLVPVTQTIMCPRPASNRKDVIASVVPSRFVLSLQPDKTNIVHIDHPFDASEYNIKYDKDYFGLPEGNLIVGSFGNNRPENSHFLDIARHFKGDNVHFVIKTDKRYKYIFGRNRVTRIERALSEDEKMSLVGLFDIFLYPTSNEAYGIVFLEAMSRKVPIISYDDSANGEVIGEGGLLAPLNDVKKLTTLVERLAASTEERRALGEKGFALFSTRNDARGIARKYEAFFDECLGKRTGL